VELQKPDLKEGWIGLLVTCEIEPGSLQQLLYDFEAGMPFLFIDQLVVQAPVLGVKGGRMRILLSVSGLWGDSDYAAPTHLYRDCRSECGRRRPRAMRRSAH
jgi:Type II secretion system (T2SS), protein M subtype b